MATLALKLILTPLLIAGASLAGRRWGPGVSGWLVGLPLTSGPVAWFLASEQGPDFAATAARGILTGVISNAAFCLGYLCLGQRQSWQRALLGGCVCFVLATAALQTQDWPAWLSGTAAIGSLLAALRLLPDGNESPASSLAAQPTRWELPARMAAATTMVLGITALAPFLGAYLAGLITPFPIYGSVLSVFAHRQSGWQAGTNVLRGLLFGLFGFTAFFLALAELLPRVGVAAGFGIAVMLDVLVQLGALALMRR